MALVYALLLSLFAYGTVTGFQEPDYSRNANEIKQDLQEVNEETQNEQEPCTNGKCPQQESLYNNLPDGYEEIVDFGVFKKVRQVEYYEDARKDCQQDGADLIVLDTSERWALSNAFLSERGNKATDGWMWVGIDYTNGRWESHSGTPVENLNFFKWEAGYPKEGHVGACTKKPMRRYWSASIDPKYKHAYICELPSRYKREIHYRQDELR